MGIRSILLNMDMLTGDWDILEEIKDGHADSPNYRDLIAAASIVSYASKEEVVR